MAHSLNFSEDLRRRWDHDGNSPHPFMQCSLGSRLRFPKLYICNYVMATLRPQHRGSSDVPGTKH